VDLAKGNVSGLNHAIDLLQHIHGIAHVEFNGTDVLRHRLVKDIIAAYEKNAGQTK